MRRSLLLLLALARENANMAPTRTSYRIHAPKPGGIFGGYRAVEAQEILTAIDNRESTVLAEACTQQGITVSRYCDWHAQRGEINRQAEREKRSQFVRLSDGIRSVRNSRRYRYRTLLELSLGLNSACQSFGVDAIEKQTEIPGRSVRVQLARAELELLEKLRILRPEDPVNVVRLTMHAAMRRGATRRSTSRPMLEEDLQFVKRQIRTLKQQHEWAVHMKTLDQRWGLRGQPPQTVQQIARAQNVSPPTVEWRELAGTFALQRHTLLHDESIPEDVRVWIALVFNTITTRAGETKRLLSRTLDHEHIADVPRHIQKLESTKRDEFHKILGITDGCPVAPESLDTDRPWVPRHSYETTIAQIAKQIGILPFATDWLNALAGAIFDQQSQGAQDVLDSGALDQLRAALEHFSTQPQWSACVQALRMRSALSDGTVHTTRDVEKATGVSKSKFSTKMRAFLHEIEVWISTNRSAD
jgi:hypothetical protein